MLLPDGSVLAVGDGIGATDPIGGGIYAGPVHRSELLSPDASAFRAVDSQQEARTYHSTALLLPDGRVLSAGDGVPSIARWVRLDPSAPDAPEVPGGGAAPPRPRPPPRPPAGRRRPARPGTRATGSPRASPCASTHRRARGPP